MIKMQSFLKNKKINVSALLLAIYVSAVWSIHLFVRVTESIKSIFLIGFIILFSSYFFFCPLINYLSGVAVSQRELNKRTIMFLFGISSLISLFVLAMWFWAFCPGSFSPDSIGQYKEAVTGEYTDWHPTIHTFFAFTIPLKITGRVESIVLLQQICFSIVLGALTVTIAKMSNIKFAVISFLYIIMNPYTGLILLYPWKDVAFGICGLLCYIFIIRLKLKKFDKCSYLWSVMFSIVLGCSILLRHNAILFTLPLLIALFFNIKRTYWLRLIIFMLLFIIIVKIPFYNLLGVKKPEKRVVETMGMPLTVIANVAKETPELMDDELSNFVYSMATQDEWNKNYSCGDFNSIKWTGIDTTIVEQKGYKGMGKLLVKCFSLSPRASFKALFSLTDIVYGFENGLDGNISPDIADNDCKIDYSSKRNIFLSKLLTDYSNFVNNSVFKYLRTYGIDLLVILVVLLSKLRFNSWDSWKRALLVMPIFTYDFGTMLLLTGPDSRFFYITFLVTPILVVYMMKIEEM